MGVSGILLDLLRDYLQERHMRVVHSGQQSSPYKIGAGVPQGSVVRPLLWNNYTNDMLNLIPSARAYPDDITESISFVPREKVHTTSLPGGMGTEVTGHLRPQQNTVAAVVQDGLTHPPELQRNDPDVATRNKHPGSH